MSKKFSNPRGTCDITPEESVIYNKVEGGARTILEKYNYKEMRTPYFEESELFARSMGQTSDVVMKQMLNLASQKSDEDSSVSLSGLSLRPEGTASIVRAYIQNGLEKKDGFYKLFYIGSMFRGERPQKGRLRQFNQIGAEAIGPNSASPYLDAELIALSVDILKSLGLNNFKVKLNTLGTAEDKEKFSQLLREKLKPQLSNLSVDSQKRFDRNVFRILDSKDNNDQKIIRDLNLDYSYLSKESLDYYNRVKETLNQIGVEFEESITLVRGLDYYTQTVFEISDERLGSQDALGAGGRYNSLVKELGGGDVDAIGFALGIERIILAGDFEKDVAKSTLNVYLVPLDEVAKGLCFNLLAELRANGISADMTFKQGSAKAQMRQANKQQSQFALIMGETELNNKTVMLKDMVEGTQKEISIQNGLDELVKIIKEGI